MYLKTLGDVNGQGLYNEIAIGRMLSIEPLIDGGIRFSAEYCKEDLTPTKSISKTYSPQEVEGLYQLIKVYLTPNINGVLSIWEQVIKAFKVEMAATFGIEISEIEIII